MPKQIQKSLQECLSKIKIPNRQTGFQLRGCRRAKTLSFGSGDKEKEDGAVTLSNVDNFLFENFRSLYDEEISKKKEARTTAFLFDSPRLLDPPPPENLCRSDRFFVTTGSSRSLIRDEASTSSDSNGNTLSATASEESAGEIAAAEEFIALLTYSPSPYEDFRRSMQEMVEARIENIGNVDWEFLQELLFCYLDLNNKKSYRFILRAFVDLIVVLREITERTTDIQPP